MMASSNCWQAPVSYVIFSEKRPKRVACARFHFSRITCICWFVRFNSSVRTASWLRNSFSCSMLSNKSCRISFLFSFASCSFDNASAIRTISLLRFYGSRRSEKTQKSDRYLFGILTVENSCSKSSSFCREYLPGCLKTGGSGLLFMWQRRLSTIHVKRIKNRTFYPHTGFRIKQKTSLFCTKVTLDVLDRSYGQMDLWSIRS